MTNLRRAFFIDPQARERPAGPAAAMGLKAYNLARMAAIGLPVPPAFVLGTGYCPSEAADAEGQAELNQVLTAQLRRLERMTGLTYGGSRRPLLLSVRSSPATVASEPACTILNVGLNETALRGLLRMTGNPRLAWDCYRRLIQSFAQVVDGCAVEPFDALLAQHLEVARVARPQELDARALSRLAREYLALYRKLAGRNFPQDTMEQLRAAVHGVFRSWNDGQAKTRRLHKTGDAPGTAVTVQRMVFGNAGGTSGSGLAFTRDPRSGEHRLCTDFTFNAQAEDVIAGRQGVDTNELSAILPTIERKLADAARALESEFRDMQELEFTVQDEVFYLLQTRAGRRSRAAEVRIALDQVREGLIEPAEGLARLARLEAPAGAEADTVTLGEADLAEIDRWRKLAARPAARSRARAN